MFNPVYLKCRSTELQIPIFWLLLFYFFHSDVNSMGLRAIQKKKKKKLNSYQEIDHKLYEMTENVYVIEEVNSKFRFLRKEVNCS